MTTYTIMAHQKESLKFCKTRKQVADFSDPGTGKTLVQILDFAQQHRKDKKSMLVLAPKSLLVTAWANDIQKFAPHLKVSVAWDKNRRQAFNADADVYVTNIDAVITLIKYPPSTWKKFGRIVIDESTAYKNHTSKRSAALRKLVEHFEWRRILTGTPMPQSICDLWHQFYILDKGKRLGTSFFNFRTNTCTPQQISPGLKILKWVDKPEIEILVDNLTSDITVRHKFENCVDIPKNHIYAVEIDLNTKHLDFYNKFEFQKLAEIKGKTITAINAAALNTKLLQVASGAVYNDQGDYSLIDNDRYELIVDLIKARKYSTVWYQWVHQLRELEKVLNVNKIDYVVWNPNRPIIAEEFQAGKYQVILCHPQSAAHGLTFTRATASILCSPTYNLEHFLQLYKRIYRIGQKSKTETIVIVGKRTRDKHAWTRMLDKRIRQDNFFSSMELK